MPYTENTVTIAAPPAFVYVQSLTRCISSPESQLTHTSADVFYDFSSFPEWNPLVRSLVSRDLTPEGRPVVGSKLEAVLHMGNPDKPMVGKGTPTVVRADDEELSWLGTKGHWTIFEGYHRFEFKKGDASGTTTTFKHSEKLRGILGWVFYMIFRRKLEVAYVTMDKKFKEEVEARYTKFKAGGAGEAGSIKD